jgi:glycosyltransferase involved in cell wall biosynthesis
MNTPADILYVIPRPEIGGAERQLLMLMQGLDRDRFRPHIICLDGEGALRDDYVDASASYHVLNRRHTVDLNALNALVDLTRRIRPAIAHTWLYIANLYGGWAARLSGVPSVIVSQRGLGIDPQHSWLKKVQMPVFNFFISQFADRLLVNASAVAEPMFQVGFSPDRTEVIYNGLQEDVNVTESEQSALRLELEIQHDDILLTAIARTDPKKDLATMIRAVALVANHHPNVRLIIAGGGFPEYQRSLERLASDLGILERVNFLGFRNDPQSLLSISHISLLSSLTEGLPNAILESMRQSRPVVATSVGGVPELITDGEHGYLVPRGDSEAFADRITRLIENPDLARQMGQAGSRKATEQFSAQAMVDTTQAVYSQLLSESGIETVEQEQKALTSLSFGKTKSPRVQSGYRPIPAVAELQPAD